MNNILTEKEYQKFIIDYLKNTMNNILTEKEYQKFIIDYLKNNNGYIVRSDRDYDRLFAMDKELLFRFLNQTQPEKMEQLEKIFKNELENTLINYINNETIKKRGSLLNVLKHGIDISNVHLDLMYTKPKTRYRYLKCSLRLNVYQTGNNFQCSAKPEIPTEYLFCCRGNLGI